MRERPRKGWLRLSCSGAYSITRQLCYTESDPAAWRSGLRGAHAGAEEQKEKMCIRDRVGDVYSAQRACLSNNCNIITLGSQVTGEKKAEALIREYLECTYTYNERSGKKVDAILEYEQRH